MAWITWLMLLLITPYTIVVLYKSVSQDLQLPKNQRPIFSAVYGLQVPVKRLPAFWLPPPFGFLITVTLHGITCLAQNDYWEYASAIVVMELHVSEAAFLFGTGRLADAGSVAMDPSVAFYAAEFVLGTLYYFYSTGGNRLRRDRTALGADANILTTTTTVDDLSTMR